MLSYQTAPTDRWEPIYGTGYSVQTISLRDPSTLGTNTNLTLPPFNTFAVRDLDLNPSDLPEEMTMDFHIPKCMVSARTGEMWAFPYPSLKSIIFLAIPLDPVSLTEFAILNLLTRIRYEGLGEIIHHVSKAQYEFAIEPAGDRLEFYVKGFKEKCGEILKRLLDAMLKTGLPREEFALYQEIVSHRRRADLEGNQSL